MPHTFVEVTKNEVPVQTLYFLVPVGRKEAVEEMRRRIAERGILVTIDSEKVKAAHLNRDLIEERGELGKSAPTTGRLYDVDGSVAFKGNVETRWITCQVCKRKLIADVETGSGASHSVVIGMLGFSCPCGERHARNGRVLSWNVEKEPPARA